MIWLYLEQVAISSCCLSRCRHPRLYLIKRVTSFLHECWLWPSFCWAQFITHSLCLPLHSLGSTLISVHKGFHCWWKSPSITIKIYSAVLSLQRRTMHAAVSHLDLVKTNLNYLFPHQVKVLYMHILNVAKELSRMSHILPLVSLVPWATESI